MDARTWSKQEWEGKRACACEDTCSQTVSRLVRRQLNSGKTEANQKVRQDYAGLLGMVGFSVLVTGSIVQKQNMASNQWNTFHNE